MTPTMLRAMGKSLLDGVANECAIHFNNNQEVPAQVQTGLVILYGLGNACKAAAEAGEAEKVALSAEDLDVLKNLEDMCRQNCITSKVDRDYNGQVAGTMVTDSGAITSHADALRTLAKHFRFRIVAEDDRMVVGYWPENDPQKQTTGKETSHG